MFALQEEARRPATGAFLFRRMPDGAQANTE
jgi:hypothetical protein